MSKTLIATLAACLSLPLITCGAEDRDRPAEAADNESGAVGSDGGGHAAISIYHHVAEDTPPVTSISPDQLREHMQYLRDNDFTVWRLDRLLEALRDGEPVPERTVSITFDDGYESIYENGLPLMQEMDFPFTLFLTTGPIDDGQNGYMSWDQVRDMADADVMIANHLVSHPHMIDGREGESEAERVERLRGELLEAERRIEEETGQSHRVLAYPYGEYDAAILEMVEEEGFTALAQNSGAVGHHSDMHALPRFPLAGSYADMENVPTKLESLAFEVRRQEPRTPITDSRNPAVTLQLVGDYEPERLSCYGGGEALEIEWLDREAGSFRLDPEREFDGRRWTYNCTAPRDGDNRFYWFSKFWTRSTPENRD